MCAPFGSAQRSVCAEYVTILDLCIRYARIELVLSVNSTLLAIVYNKYYRSNRTVAKRKVRLQCVERVVRYMAIYTHTHTITSFILFACLVMVSDCRNRNTIQTAICQRFWRPWSESMGSVAAAATNSIRRSRWCQFSYRSYRRD